MASLHSPTISRYNLEVDIGIYVKIAANRGSS